MGVRKFYAYLYGHTFTLVTDHKPLLAIFNPGKATSTTTGARLQRYAMYLSGFQYSIRYKNTKAHGNCDSLSRLPLQESEVHRADSTDTYVNSLLDCVPVSSANIAAATRRDKTLSQVLELVATGWTRIDEVRDDLRMYMNRRNELTLHQGCLMWGNRVIIPEELQETLLQELHVGHVGIQKMKTLARSYVWWPTLDIDIEGLTKKCSGCMAVKNNPPEAPIHPWEYPCKPWSRVHIDFAGPFLGHMYLVMVDAYSKWPIVSVMKSTTATKTVEVIRSAFADYGLCDEIVSDNGPQFVSSVFKDFLKKNGVRHITSAPYHPKTNGLAERFVQTLKQALKSAKKDQGTIETKISRFLLQYRNSEHSTTKETPARLFLGRNTCTRLDKVKPSLRDRVQKEQSKMVRSERDRQFDIGQEVAIRDYRQNQEKWIHGVVNEKTGPVSYRVSVAPGVCWRRHADQMRVSSEKIPHSIVYGQSVLQDSSRSMSVNNEVPRVSTEHSSITDTPVEEPATNSQQVLPETTSVIPRRNPARVHKKPDKLNL